MPATTDTAIPSESHRIYRHSAVVRVTHWINVLCLALLLTSGLMIFNAHPQLDWGEASNFDRSFVELRAEYGKDGQPAPFPAGSRFLMTTTSRRPGAGISSSPGSSC